jgi:Xaa-Pro aminopeptidase
VGSYLSVHEGPQRISKIPNNVALKPGMIISNEPGYYKEGAYGIRIENLLTVTEAQTIEGGELPMMGFEVLTLAPIDLNLVEPTLLSEDEIAWLNGYHKRVFEEIGPALEARGWLAQATRAI